jgi:hypothetical protein
LHPTQLVLALAAGIMSTSVRPRLERDVSGVGGLSRRGAGAGRPHVRPDATLAIFHGRHYSRIEVQAEQPRPVLADQATASADQLRAAWGPFVGEAGTFELSANNTITMQATVAKNPAAMKPGAQSVFTYRREGDLLILTQLRTPAGPSPEPITIKLTRVE